MESLDIDDDSDDGKKKKKKKDKKKDKKKEKKASGDGEALDSDEEKARRKAERKARKAEKEAKKLAKAMEAIKAANGEDSKKEKVDPDEVMYGAPEDGQGLIRANFATLTIFSCVDNDIRAAGIVSRVCSNFCH